MKKQLTLAFAAAAVFVSGAQASLPPNEGSGGDGAALQAQLDAALAREAGMAGGWIAQPAKAKKKHKAKVLGPSLTLSPLDP